ncbi:MAG: type I-B CRISPR-associated protein Cas7/Cst2/DevR [Thermosulfidibacteraceae bacterium]|uniref:type I-B CRISPR-associated protein Cas7/Cst2/DevR n=1 Tax=Thermovenabulum sp. TaxID=3100335 RepID=UPI003C7DC32C
MNNKNNKKLIDRMLEEARWVEVIDIFRVESANINAGEGGPAEIDVKTVHLEDGTVVPRISPQAIFRMIRDYWIEIGEKVDVARKEPGKTIPLPECDPVKYIDDDLFGYLMARRTDETEEGNGEKSRKSKGISESRPGPIRSIGAIGLFEYPDDTDFLTSIISTTGAEEGGSMVTKRIYTNTFILPIWCDVKRIGCEAIPQKDKSIKFEPLNGITPEERRRRILKFFESLFYLGKSMPGASKMPLSPKLIMVGLFNKPNITLYDALENDLSVRIKEVRLQKEQTRPGEEKIVSIASGKVIFSIEPEAFLEKCNLYEEDIIEIKIGILEAFFDKKAEEIEQTIEKKIEEKKIKKTIKDKVKIVSLESLKSELLS